MDVTELQDPLRCEPLVHQELLFHFDDEVVRHFAHHPGKLTADRFGGLPLVKLQDHVFQKGFLLPDIID